MEIHLEVFLKREKEREKGKKKILRNSLMHGDQKKNLGLLNCRNLHVFNNHQKGKVRWQISGVTDRYFVLS